jgi:hypothetical protein
MNINQMRTIIFIFLSIFSIANGQNKKNNAAVRDNNLKVPENYSRRLPEEPIYGICGNDGAVLVENAENYEYNFYKKDNHIYFQGKLTTINADGFERISYSYYKNKSNVYYYTTLELQKIEGIDAKSTHLINGFLADKNSLYYKTIKIIEGQNFESVSNSLNYQEVIIKNTTDNALLSNYYIVKNNKGYWIIKISNTILSYNFLGKMFNPKWEKDTKEIKLDDSQIFAGNSVEIVPEYPGGVNEFYNFLKKEYKIPNEEGLKGRIYASFVVEKNGVLSGIKILRDIGYGTGEEFIRVLKLSSKWKPATQNGQNVRCSYSLPFTIDSSIQAK